MTICLIYFPLNSYFFVGFPVSFIHIHHLKTFGLIILILVLSWWELVKFVLHRHNLISVILNSTPNLWPSKWNGRFCYCVLVSSQPSLCDLFPCVTCYPLIWACCLLTDYLSYFIGATSFYTLLSMPNGFFVCFHFFLVHFTFTGSSFFSASN